MTILGGTDPLLDGLSEFFFEFSGEEGVKVGSVGGRAANLLVVVDVAGSCGGGSLETGYNGGAGGGAWACCAGVVAGGHGSRKEGL